MKSENIIASEVPHNIILEGRRKISISGVLDVESFDEHEIIIETSKGMLTITGEDMRVDKLNIESKDTVIEGNIVCIEYNDAIREHGSFWSRIF